MPMRTWEALSDRHKVVLEVACGDTLSWTAAEAVVHQVEALRGFRAMGVELHAWPDDVLLDLRLAWEELIAEEAARDPLLAEAWDGYIRFRDGYGDWQARAYTDWQAQPGMPASLSPSSTMSRPVPSIKPSKD